MTAAQTAEADQRAKDAQESQEQRHKATCVKRLIGQVGPRYGPGRATLDAFRLGGPGFSADHKANQKFVLAKCRQLAENLAVATKLGRGVVWHGPTRTGKDHMATALLYVAAGRFGIDCEWVLGSSIWQAFRENMSRKGSEAELIRRYYTPTILCISDPVPVAGENSAWQLEILKRILDYRCCALKPTWATVNVHNDADGVKMLTAPVWARLANESELLACFWPAWKGRQ
jgi:DNA replication protein DnaC